MKRKIAVTMTILFALTVGLAGCQTSKGLTESNIEIPQYKEIEIDEVEGPDEVTEDDIMAYIDEKRSENDMKEVTDRPAKEGDTVDIDFVGKMNGEEFDGGSAEGYYLVLGSGDFIDGFEDSIIGHNVGDTFDWSGKFPDDYEADEDLAGKDVVFTITLNAIYEDEDVQLDDDFVKSVSDTSTTVDEYKDEVKDILTEEAEIQHRLAIADAAWEKVAENTEVKEYNEDDVQSVYDQMMEQYEAYAQAYGMDLESFIAAFGYDSMETFEDEVMEASKESVKDKLMVDAIADKEKLTLDDDTYESILKDMALYYGYESAETLKESIDEAELKEAAKQFMVKEWVGDHCIQVASDETPASDESDESEDLDEYDDSQEYDDSEEYDESEEHDDSEEHE